MRRVRKAAGQLAEPRQPVPRARGASMGADVGRLRSGSGFYGNNRVERMTLNADRSQLGYEKFNKRINRSYTGITTPRLL